MGSNDPTLQFYAIFIYLYILLNVELVPGPVVLKTVIRNRKEGEVGN